MDSGILRGRKNLETRWVAQSQKLRLHQSPLVSRGYSPANNSPKATRTPGTLAHSRLSLPV